MVCLNNYKIHGERNFGWKVETLRSPYNKYKLQDYSDNTANKYRGARRGNSMLPLTKLGKDYIRDQ